jgi:hypothetical protein
MLLEGTDWRSFRKLLTAKGLPDKKARFGGSQCTVMYVERTIVHCVGGCKMAMPQNDSLPGLEIELEINVVDADFEITGTDMEQRESIRSLACDANARCTANNAYMPPTPRAGEGMTAGLDSSVRLN